MCYGNWLAKVLHKIHITILCTIVSTKAKKTSMFPLTLSTQIFYACPKVFIAIFGQGLLKSNSFPVYTSKKNLRSFTYLPVPYFFFHECYWQHDYFFPWHESSTMIGLPYWFLKIHHVDKYNVTESENISYLNN